MRVYVEAYGCSQNLGEAAEIERALHSAGHSIAPGPSGAEGGVLVTCAVIGPTEARMVRRWAWLAERLPKVVVTGCLVPLRTGLLTGSGLARTVCVPIREQARIPALFGNPSADPPALQVDPGAAAEVAPRAVQEVTVAQGCTSACAYCYSRLARGPLQSTAPQVVESKVEAAVSDGAVEVRLSSLDTSCWGEDRPGPDRLPELLAGIARIPGEFRVRVGMMSPQSLGPIAPRLWPVERGERFFQFLHLPVQSGSDSVLAAMHRGYQAADFRSLVDAARRGLREPMISTDVIVGYPTETEPDFRATLDLLEDVAPETVNVTRFSPRPGTPAARLRPLPGRVVKDRSRALAVARGRIARRRLEAWIGREESVLIVEAGTAGTSVGRLSNYLPVVIPETVRAGTRLPVRISGARSNYLHGDRIAGRPD
ncbi:MAG TPA: tRNA (N(6)-L-threonylcarbamoyladenosine(37)-C(2))-methylthiotransferase [Thermoplasmata archaeon]|nr:tRNA (N(6)-L-threonylcarbamoyladenosine(37)-C(2))-methylthiotransferase [Thermoplasmata archaeon]